MFLDTTHAEEAQNQEITEIISWSKDGKTVMIHDKKLFKRKILPKFFQNIKYTSWTKQMRRWGFICYAGGAPRHNAVSFSNPIFIRGDMEMCKRIRSVEPHHQQQQHQHHPAPPSPRVPSCLSASSSQTSPVSRRIQKRTTNENPSSPLVLVVRNSRATSTASNQQSGAADQTPALRDKTSSSSLPPPRILQQHRSSTRTSSTSSTLLDNLLLPHSNESSSRTTRVPPRDFFAGAGRDYSQAFVSTKLLTSPSSTSSGAVCCVVPRKDVFSSSSLSSAAYVGHRDYVATSTVASSQRRRRKLYQIALRITTRSVNEEIDKRILHYAARLVSEKKMKLIKCLSLSDGEEIAVDQLLQLGVSTTTGSTSTPLV